MCCNENRVVTAYATDRLVLIGTRKISSGDHLSKGELDQLGAELQVERPKGKNHLSANNV